MILIPVVYGELPMRQLTEKKKLSDRERRFSELCQQFSCTRPGKLLAFHQITEEKFKTLQMSIVFFLQSCLSNSNQRPNPSKEGSVVADFFHRIDEVELADGTHPFAEGRSPKSHVDGKADGEISDNDPGRGHRTGPQRQRFIRP